jgi:hypothetical protein
MKKENTKKKLINKEAELQSLLNSMRLFYKFSGTAMLLCLAAALVSLIFGTAYVQVYNVKEIKETFAAIIITFALAAFTVVLLTAISGTVIGLYDKKHSTKNDSINTLNEE